MEVLPNDLVRKCLLRVPYKSHDDLKAVCREWEAIVNNPKFYADRKISGTSEQLICLYQNDEKVDDFVVTVYDPVKDTWETLSPIDDPECVGIPQLCECVAVNRKLVLIGGMHPESKITMKSVYIYDFVSARWSRGADMPTPRYAFAWAFSSSTGLIYVAGGVNEGSIPLAATEAYNVEENKWEILPPMIKPHSLSWQGVFMKGNFMVINVPKFDRSAEIFDPSAGTWRRSEDMWNSLSENLWGSCKVARSSSDLYVFIKQDIMKYDAGKNIWTAVATLPRDIHFGQLVPRVTQWRDGLFVTGYDLFKREPVHYLVNSSTGQSIEVNSDGGGDIDVSIALSAATVEI